MPDPIQQDQTVTTDPVVQAASAGEAPYVPMESAEDTEARLDEAAKVLTDSQRAEVDGFAKNGDYRNAICALTHYLNQ